jgi:hypothetical protein
MATRFYSNVEYGSQGGRGSNDPDVIYYNACIVNNSTTDDDPSGYGSNQDRQVVFNDQRQIPILQNASEYNMSVIRFDLAGATKSLPLFVPRIEIGQSNINLTIYKLWMTLIVTIKPTAGLTVTKKYTQYLPIQWAPQYSTTDNKPAPATPENPYQVFSTDYYFCDSYSWWCSLVNGTAAELQQSLIEEAIADGVAFPPDLVNYEAVDNSGSPAPHLFYNPVTKLFSWSFDNRYWGAGYALNPTYSSGGNTYTYSFYLGMDTNLETLLTNFIINYTDNPGGNPINNFPIYVNALIVTPQQIAIDTDPTTGQPYTNPGTGGHIRYVITQDYQSTSGNWSPIDSIVITSTKLPISQEIVAPAPGTFGSSDLGFSSGTSGAAFQQVIADIQVGERGADEWRQYMEYEPKAEYRILSFNKSTEPIQNIDFLVWWRNRYDNNLYPLRLYNGSSVSLKVMFRRKGF